MLTIRSLVGAPVALHRFGFGVFGAGSQERRRRSHAKVGGEESFAAQMARGEADELAQRAAIRAKQQQARPSFRRELSPPCL